jgi:HSP20 family protein
MSTWDLDLAVNRVFDDFIKDLNVARRGGTHPSRVNAWTPVMDIHESDKEFIVNSELPVCI